MRKLSRKISLQFLLFVLAVLTLLVTLLAITFIQTATDEYKSYLTEKKQSVFQWFIDLRRDLKLFVDRYALEHVLESGYDILVQLGDEREIILNRSALSDEEIDEIERSGNGFKMLERQLVYFSTIVSNEVPYLAGIIFDNNDIESLSSFIGQDGIAFLLIGDYFVIPREFSDSGLYVRTVLDEEKWSEETPFTVSEPRPAFSFFSSGSLFIVDKVSIGGADIYVLQSQGLLVKLRNRLLPIISIVVLGVFGFSFVLSFSLNAHISKALSELLKGFESIKKGSFSRVKINSNDELGEIASELNNTMVFIERTLDRLKNSNELLRKVSKEAQQASKMKSEFLANMSHEMRTPMNAILGFAELLMNDETNLEKMKYLKTIYRSGEHLLSLINDVLDLSKIEAARFDLMISPYSPSKLVNELTETYLPMAYSKGLHFANSVTERVPEYVDGDEFRMRQILTNLISNGLKFTEKGYVSILLDYDGKYLIYTVQDTGFGVSRDELEEIFEPFIQADGTMSRKFGGTGLGLAITKKIVELMGGTIRFESKVGEGSKVTVRIPSQVSKEAPKQKERAEISMAGKVILASDDDDFLIIVGSMLTRNGIHYQPVKNLTNLSRAVKDLGASLAIVDTPRKASEALTALDGIYDASIIAITDAAKDEVQFGDRVDEVIQKPVREEELMKSIGNYFELAPKAGSEKYRILLTEDNEANQLLIKEVLEKAGYSVDLASNGKNAVEMIRNNKYNLVLMDMQMPIMDGYEATKVLREEGYKIPIVALTAHTMQGDEEKTIEAGCDGFLGKPVSQSDLLEVVRYHLGIYGKTGKKRDGEQARSYKAKHTQDSISLFAKDMGLSFEEASAMFEEYGEHIHKTIDEIQNALERRNFDSISRDGHSLKGSGRMYGVEELSEVGFKLETAGKSGDDKTIADCILELKKLYRKLWA
ncbi:response regulator [Mesotoga sp.]|uniref:hybrid sensor histidine kinase/response regulator n=1 Tax=Mesotoga sp. TaxID=2053577 RepID=UPI001BD6B944|nr:response regulator [Mesotoga sp.]